MKKHKIDYDMPIGELKRIDDFLPPPKELAVPEQTVMVTLRLSEKSVDFFKEQAKKYHTKYQKMLRFLVDKYAERYS
ncbi:MAG: CopG family transcriptional regulator [Omnitrophica bacterium RIFCSPLOWO2_02_FULL_45_16]|nr:MAG: CopG family transcriptional regulator [Omnitrophica bacterium RIFCSPHIGHO2_02_FULL_46_20]OGW93375.1 MAG: CopG family transcriptional regulator [Omnitrophica bacterium RIFCSPLOWO2_12_FULL_45_13]OGW94882.1 MAG: CopG family transcriptional regulator [Omnitrophica bacterium RIFCSPLOWO2_01_FULL_45_24]OGW99963.1 MAG: CopG family transcriptional regulator [Omnitrophica bacterium RIFCSPLOWO2_02_FULL_45_16]